MNRSNFINKTHRKIQLHLLGKTTPEQLLLLGEKKLLRLFHKSQNASPALCELLKNKRIEVRSVNNITEFTALDFIMAKENTFNSYPIDKLCRPGALKNLGGILTSSGHSGNFAYGLSSWQQKNSAADHIDLALENAFQTDSKNTLLINCLPMGVRFPSNQVTLAEVSVREDMALAILEKFSPHYDQTIIICDPLFLKLLLDAGRARHFDWRNIHNHVIIGEETFGEDYRSYVADKMGIDLDDPATGIIGSSMGAGELGLNLCFETPETIALRRAININPALKKKLFGIAHNSDPLPMLFAYNPLAFYLEIHQPDENGYGGMLVSILDKSCPVPLFRYHTGDEARLLACQDIIDAFLAEGLPPPQLPKMPLICIRGRQGDRLADGQHISIIKDTLYANRDFADRITGAFRINRENPDIIHVQLRRGENPDRVVPPASGLYSTIKLWDYDAFPFGKTIDYERKFTYLS